MPPFPCLAKKRQVRPGGLDVRLHVGVAAEALPQDTLAVECCDEQGEEDWSVTSVARQLIDWARGAVVACLMSLAMSPHGGADEMG